MANKNGEKITMDGLARIINKGFNGQMVYMEKRFGQIEQKMATKDQVQKLETRIISVKTKLDTVDERFKKVETVLSDAHVL